MNIFLEKERKKSLWSNSPETDSGELKSKARRWDPAIFRRETIEGEIIAYPLACSTG